MVPLFLGAVLGIAGGLLGGFGKAKAASSQAAAMRLNAQQVRERSTIESTLRERTGDREAGSINAAAGAGGLAGGGSAADILRESVRNTEFDLRTIKDQSELEARALEKGAKGVKTGGILSGITGAATTAAGFLI